jgi:hypothetical protein
MRGLAIAVVGTNLADGAMLRQRYAVANVSPVARRGRFG